jgi:predicted O-methyltransferase YrrM
MRADEFVRALPTLWDGDPAFADHPRDRRFRSLLDDVGGMATENKLALLNLAASFLDPDDVYLEIGTYLGTSVIAAAMDNDGRFIAVDNYSQFGGPEDRCRENIRRYAAEKVTLVNRDAWEFLASFHERVGVYFYDAGHTFREQWCALEMIEPHLTDDAIVVIDDASHWPVQRANNDFTKHRPQFERLQHFSSSSNGEPRWWNGVDLYRYRRARSQTVPRLSDSLLRFRDVAVAGPPYETARTFVVAPARRAISWAKRALTP